MTRLMRHQQDNAILEPGTVRIIVIGGSAGSLSALRTITGEFPTEFGAAILVVEHISLDFPCDVPRFLSKDGVLVWSTNSICLNPIMLRAERTIQEKHSETDVTQRYTAPRLTRNVFPQPFGAGGHHPWFQHVRVF